MASNKQELRYELLWEIFWRSHHSDIIKLQAKLYMARRGLLSTPKEVMDYAIK